MAFKFRLGLGRVSSGESRGRGAIIVGPRNKVLRVLLSSLSLNYQGRVPWILLVNLLIESSIGHIISIMALISKSRDALLRAAAASLTTAGVSSAELNARVLLEHTLGSRDANSIGRRPRAAAPLSPSQHDTFSKLVARRAMREPLQYIIGEWDFDCLRSLQCRPPVLIPRPETELLVALAAPLVATAGPHPHFLELGVGSGAVTAALLTRTPTATAVGVDLSQAALGLAQENYMRFGVAGRASLELGDAGSFALAPGARPFDVVVANPPYIPAWEMPSLEPEVRGHEDVGALAGGAPAGAGALLAWLRGLSRGGGLTLPSACGKGGAAASRSVGGSRASRVLLETHVLHAGLLACMLHGQSPLGEGAGLPLRYSHDDSAEGVPCIVPAAADGEAERDAPAAETVRGPAVGSTSKKPAAATAADLAAALRLPLGELDSGSDAASSLAGLWRGAADLRASFAFVRFHRDYAGRPRVVELVARSAAGTLDRAAG